MKKHILIIFFTFHLLLIFFQAVWTTVDGYWIYHFNKAPDVPGLNLFKQNPRTELYYILSGTNTGYGFYGIKTSTEKFLRLTFFDDTGKIIGSDRYFGLSTRSGMARLGSYASYLANYIADTEKLQEDETRSPENKGFIEFRKDYVRKALKWLGKKEAEAFPGCESYKIELLTVIPEDIRDRKDRKPELYVIEEGLYPIR
ncbi:hypothetical protein SAMN02927921_04279 [Sinomicrobium oceani]|uniref:Uncharacterized protein n=1 Tax=Sinomicrobium oceani TaxID=1150368 RepID=A0A1K1S1F9_9FLAO|nr:hypothetical protein [Sinomicrobium oceani]SFW77893.1 hypothetical protein SAMN02927921_04279 [Sinomicrobium oceani]